MFWRQRRLAPWFQACGGSSRWESRGDGVSVETEEQVRIRRPTLGEGAATAWRRRPERDGSGRRAQIACTAFFLGCNCGRFPRCSLSGVLLGLFINLLILAVLTTSLCISAIFPPATSAIQAEAFGLMLASQIAGTLQIQQAAFLTDCAMLATGAASQNMMLAPRHLSIRPQLAQIAASTAFDASRIYHINRGFNFRSHHQAKLALKTQNASFS